MNIKTKDIASKSGVSIATVSRYLNKSGYVKQETRELIKNAIQEIKKQENIYEKEKNTIKYTYSYYRSSISYSTSGRFR